MSLEILSKKHIAEHRLVLLEDLRSDLEFSVKYLIASLRQSPRVFWRAVQDVTEARYPRECEPKAGGR